MTKVLALLALICLASGQAGVAAEQPVVLADWQYPDRLPERFRNHCSNEYFTGRQYCADHCGSGYQFFYCSEGSFGCCHLGRGYCDIHGILRCSP
ncbi:MAG: hypothetical protein WBB34_11685 [Xanthobacteraceae bacterium]